VLSCDVNTVLGVGVAGIYWVKFFNSLEIAKRGTWVQASTCKKIEKSVQLCTDQSTRRNAKA